MRQCNVTRLFLWHDEFGNPQSSLPTNNSEIQNQAKSVLDAIAVTPFEQCQPLSRDFSEIPDRPGIYAIRHRYQGLLYIGKTKSLRSRFRGGHKAFL